MDNFSEGIRLIQSDFEQMKEEIAVLRQQIPKKQPSELLSVDELACRLKILPSWVYNQTRIRDGSGIPHIKVGKYCRFYFDDVVEWLKSRQCNEMEN